jgi:hypothetical protein
MPFALIYHNEKARVYGCRGISTGGHIASNRQMQKMTSKGETCVGCHQIFRLSEYMILIQEAMMVDIF